MDSVKEKLVELVGKARKEAAKKCRSFFSCKDCPNQDDNNPMCRSIYIAESLIANGVTVQELDGCKYCRNASYTENPFTVITQNGKEVKTQFNFCPNCGRRLPQPPKGE